MLAAIPAIIKAHAEEQNYRIYITDALKIIAENTAHLIKGGQYLTQRYADAISPKQRDNRTGDEIAIDFVNRAGLKLKGEGGGSD